VQRRGTGFAVVAATYLVAGIALWPAVTVAAPPGVLDATFVSVPLMDRRSLARRPEYANHIRHTRALLPLPRKSGSAL